MESNVHELEKQLLMLSTHERAFLARVLIHSLDDEEGEPDLEQKWIEEAQRRYEGHKAGKTSAKSASDVIKDAKAKFS
jgi:putative addiction module component (TIGR02574 family)